MSPNSPDDNDGRPDSGEEPIAVERPSAEPENEAPAEGEDAAVPELEAAVPAEAEPVAEPPELIEPSEPPVADQLEEARAALQRIKEQLLRTAADFDNYRKRSRREIDDAHKQGREELLRELLPVFDNLERAAAHAGQATDAKAVADGVNMVLRQFLDTLGKIGIRRISAVGQVFDPMQHEAIHQVESAEHAPGTVVEEAQPGYAMGDRLIRAAMVVVAKPRQASTDEPADPNPD